MADVALKRGDVVLVSLAGARGVEKKWKASDGERPCGVVQSNKVNAVSPQTIVVPLTHASRPKSYPFHVFVSAAALGPGGKDSVATCEHVRAIDRDLRVNRENGVLAHLPDDVMTAIDDALKVILGL